MSSSSNDMEEASSSGEVLGNGKVHGNGEAEVTSSASERPPAKRRLSATVIEISDTESDDSDICAVTTYQASADEVKRIRGDYSSSSSSSYSSDSDSGCEDDSNVIDSIVCSVAGASLNPRAGRTDDPLLNPHFKAQELIDKVATNWRELKDYTSKDITLTSEPFPLCLLHNFLENAEFINNIVDDMNTVEWSRKRMDLYEFHQTADLANLTWQRSIRGIYELLKTDVMNWVSQVTGLELTNVSASCSLYGPGDHLLVHDDMLGDRRVAFIMYLAPWTPNARSQNMENGSGSENEHSPKGAGGGGAGAGGGGGGWRAGMGGALQLLARDARGRPAAAARRVLPANNTLAFFRVGRHSYHQVEEVTSLELPRLSINGWYHGPAPEPEAEPEAAPEPPPERAAPPEKPHADVVAMGSWVRAAYMSPRARAQVQAQVEAASEVSLRDFLLPPRYDALLRALQLPEIPWELCGPANQRRYHRIKPSWLDEPPPADASSGLVEPVEGAAAVRAAARLLRSAAWLRVLADCTDLALLTHHALELQRWAPGDYTLLPPRDTYQHARLEVLLHVGAPARALCGGATVFAAPEEAEAEAEAEPEAAAAGGALVSVPPRANALALVYCDAGAARFTKYVSRITMRPAERFYVLTCTYRE